MATNAIIQQLTTPETLAALIIRNNTYAVFSRLVERGSTPKDATIQAVAEKIHELSAAGQMNDVIYALSVPIQKFALTGLPDPEAYDQAVGALAVQFAPKIKKSTKDGTPGPSSNGGGNGGGGSFWDGLGSVLGDINWGDLVNGIFGSGNDGSGNGGGNGGNGGGNGGNDKEPKPFDWTPVIVIVSILVVGGGIIAGIVSYNNNKSK